MASSSDGGATYSAFDPTASPYRGQDSVFRIYGSPVPEPAFYQLGALLALGGLVTLRFRRRA